MCFKSKTCTLLFLMLVDRCEGCFAGCGISYVGQFRLDHPSVHDAASPALMFFTSMQPWLHVMHDGEGKIFSKTQVCNINDEYWTQSNAILLQHKTLDQIDVGVDSQPPGGEVVAGLFLLLRQRGVPPIERGAPPVWPLVILVITPNHHHRSPSSRSLLTTIPIFIFNLIEFILL